MLKNKTMLVILAAVAVVLVAAGVLLTQSGSPATATASVIQNISPSDYQSQFSTTSAPHLLVDVRTPEEFVTGHIAGAVNISLQTLQGRLGEIPRDQPVVLYCRSGNRSAEAARILADAGYTNIRDLGGIITWVGQGYPVQ